MRGKTIDKLCNRCKQPHTVRVADVKRGWGKFCSKSCKASEQTQRTGVGSPDTNYMGSGVSRERYLDDAKEYGGTPLYDRRGEHVGFIPTPFDNTTDCQNSDPYTPRDR